MFTRGSPTPPFITQTDCVLRRNHWGAQLLCKYFTTVRVTPPLKTTGKQVQEPHVYQESPPLTIQTTIVCVHETTVWVNFYVVSPPPASLCTTQSTTVWAHRTTVLGHSPSKNYLNITLRIPCFPRVLPPPSQHKQQLCVYTSTLCGSISL